MGKKRIRIFVYGSLREGQSNNSLLRDLGAQRVGRNRPFATEPAFTLHDLGSFPAITRDGTTSVVGEVYILPNEAALARIDQLEGHPNFYRREFVRLDDGSVAWGYVLVQRAHLSHSTEIQSGDWVAYRRGDDGMLGDKRTIYFAFGSNLVADQMKARCPTATLIGKAKLLAHRIAFAGWSAAWRGGVATFLPNRPKTVPGALWSISLDELLALDGYEGHPHCYQRVDIEVSLDDGQKMRAWTYKLVREPCAPSAKYLAAIIEGRAQLGMPDNDVLDAAIRANEQEEERREAERKEERAHRASLRAMDKAMWPPPQRPLFERPQYDRPSKWEPKPLPAVPEERWQKWDPTSPDFSKRPKGGER